MGYFLRRQSCRRSSTTTAACSSSSASTRRQPEACFRELYQRSLWWGRVGLGLSVLSGIEMALWDIAGKAAGRPVHELLGGPAHDRLPLYASGGTGSWPLEQTVDQAQPLHLARAFAGSRSGPGFEGRPGGFTTAPGKPPYGTWYARQHGRRGSPTSARSSVRFVRRSVLTSSSPRTAMPCRSASRGRAGRRSISPARSSRSTSSSWRSRSATTTRPGYAELRRATRVPIAGGECLTGDRRVRPLPGRSVRSTTSSPTRPMSAGSR